MKAKPKRRASKAPARRPVGSSSLLGDFNQALGALPLSSETSDLAREVLTVAAGQPGISGARLWRVAEGPPSVWCEIGELPQADAALAESALLHPVSFPATSQGARWACPLAGNGTPLGVLEAATSDTNGLDAAARERLEILGRYAGVALANSEHRHTVAELSSIVEATKKLNSTLDLGELINIILQMASRLTGADRGAVFLVDQERQEIWSLVALGLEQQEIRLPSSKGVAGWVARHGTSVNLGDAYQDPRFERDVDRRLGYKTQTLLCLPIRGKDGDIVGVLQLLNKKGGPFTSADEKFLGALSDHVALALENARLHRELLIKQRLERDLALARSIQRGLLPEHPPAIAGFDIAVSHTPSQMVGGDYYDFIPLNDQTLLTVVADVEGKGVASALVMANLQATLRALVAHVHSLERIVGSVNNMILADNRAQKYLSMFAGLLDRRHSVLHYINAGHVPPAVVKVNAPHVYLREGGMVVGLFPDQEYERGHIRLEPGDIVVACTDGITEAMDVHSNEFGNERLVVTVRRESSRSAQQIVEAVLAEVDLFSRGGPHEDDRVIFILKAL